MLISPSTKCGLAVIRIGLNHVQHSVEDGQTLKLNKKCCIAMGYLMPGTRITSHAYSALFGATGRWCQMAQELEITQQIYISSWDVIRVEFCFSTQSPFLGPIKGLEGEAGDQRAHESRITTPIARARN